MKPPHPASHPATSSSAAPGQVRIIGGIFKRSKLLVLGKPGLRPTPSRVRETVFNWLGQDLSGLRCVDAFAGTGALGFEAASRGASDVLLIEQDAQVLAQLHTQKTRLKADAIRIQRGDGIAALRALAPASTDVIFIDPPFESGLHRHALDASAHAISDHGLIYLESPRAWSNEEVAPANLQIAQHGKAGEVHYHLLQRVQLQARQ